MRIFTENQTNPTTELIYLFFFYFFLFFYFSTESTQLTLLLHFYYFNITLYSYIKALALENKFILPSLFYSLCDGTYGTFRTKRIKINSNNIFFYGTKIILILFLEHFFFF
jgi:hypothetical protein